MVTVHGFRPARRMAGGVQRSGLGKKLKVDNGNPRNKMWVLPHNYQCAANFQIESDEAGRFSHKYAFKMEFGYKNTTLEPLNL